MKSSNRIGVKKKLSHPISEEDLRKAVNIFLKNKKGKLLPNLDERCDLNISFVNTVLHECIMPKKGAGIKPIRNEYMLYTPTVKQEPGESTSSVCTLERDFSSILNDTNYYSLSSDEKVFHNEKSRGSKPVMTNQMPKNLQSIEKELTESQDVLRYGLIELLLNKSMDGYDSHLVAFYGYDKQLWFIDVTNTEAPYDNPLFKKLEEGINLKDYQPEGYIYYYNRIGKPIEFYSMSLQSTDPINSMSHSSLIPSTSPIDINPMSQSPITTTAIPAINVNTSIDTSSSFRTSILN